MASRPPREGVIVLGTPRSGTTMLRRILDAHPDIACPGETNLFSACARFLESETIVESTDIGVLAGLGFAGFTDDEVLVRLREFAFGFHREHAARAGKRRWAEKTAFDSFHIDAIAELVGSEVDFICVQRHGLDVACSIQELCEKNGVYLREIHEYIQRYPRPLEAFARLWVDLTEELLSFAQRTTTNAAVVRYEDLVARPDATMSAAMSAIGETWDDEILARALSSKSGTGLGDWKTYRRTTIDTASIGRWRKLPRSVVSALGKICNPTLMKCGYDPVEVEDELSADEARRRYELGLMIGTIKPVAADDDSSQ